ncbi:MAG: HD family hydrolase [Hyphomicrobiales bacterium]|nr:HD family hydrolase [Hyphomicrobiales bacterium]
MSKKPRAWQRMLSGRRLDLLDPSPLDIEIEDIAHGLARTARWNGQTTGPHIFSVAQHSLLVETLAARLDLGIGARGAMFALLHDAPEYVIGDMISPFKAQIGEAYKDVEARLLDAILMRFGLTKPSPALKALVKRADRAAAFYEATAVAGFGHAEATQIFGAPEIRPRGLARLLGPMSADEAEAAFLARFAAVGAQSGSLSV